MSATVVVQSNLLMNGHYFRRYDKRFGRNFTTISDVYFHRADVNKDGEISNSEFEYWFRDFVLFRARLDFYSSVRVGPCLLRAFVFC